MRRRGYFDRSSGDVLLSQREVPALHVGTAGANDVEAGARIGDESDI